MKPARGLLLVQPIKTQESWGPLVLLEETRQRWAGMQCEVLKVGAPEVCEDEECNWLGHGLDLRGNLTAEHDYPDHVHTCNIAVGDWLLVRPRCFVPTDQENVWVCKQSDVLAKLVLS